MFLNWLLVVVGLSVLLSSLGFVLSKKIKEVSKEKNSPFECGFNPCEGGRVSFSFHFFLVALIFIVFDVELLLLYPYIMLFKSGGGCLTSEVRFVCWVNCVFESSLFVGMVYKNTGLKVVGATGSMN
uniref:NADH-ubiquinone oxidoreductase chain 3 n=1 Tax=Tigriopus japonicus TaxID=158387 RepID=Q8M6U3_TIGJA|nr:NADH dehydrogenase subunit 3 [Tigriopus japonicus]